MNLQPVFHTISPLRLFNAEQSLHRARFPVHQESVSPLSMQNIAGVPTPQAVAGYSVEQLRAVDQLLQPRANLTSDVGALVNILV